MALARPVALSAAISAAVTVPAAGPLGPALARCGDPEPTQSAPRDTFVKTALCVSLQPFCLGAQEPRAGEGSGGGVSLPHAGHGAKDGTVRARAVTPHRRDRQGQPRPGWGLSAGIMPLAQLIHVNILVTPGRQSWLHSVSSPPEAGRPWPRPLTRASLLMDHLPAPRGRHPGGRPGGLWSPELGAYLGPDTQRRRSLQLGGGCTGPTFPPELLPSRESRQG